MELPGALLSRSSKKIKKIHPEKISFNFKKENFLAPKSSQKSELKNQKGSHFFLKTFSYFLIFWEIKLSGSNDKKFLIYYQKKNFSYISGNGTFIYFRQRKPYKLPEVIFRALKIKKHS